MSNNLNAMMDHVWDGFYSGQKRLQRFPSLIQAEPGSVYNLNHTGTPAKKYRFAIKSLKAAGQTTTTGSTIRIAYSGAESRAVYVNGVIIPANDWDDNTKSQGAIQQTSCGENRYIGVQNILEFYLTTDCDLQIKPRDAIQTAVRMEWTMDAFFSDGGTTTFIDRLTASLGIHASTVKIVSVYEGSLVVNYEIAPPDGDASKLDELAAKQNEMLSSNSVDLGGKVLSVEAKVSRNVEAKGFTGVVTKSCSVENQDQFGNCVNPDLTIEEQNALIASQASYNPISIMNSEYSQNNQNEQNAFNPDMEFMTQEQINYYESTVQVQKQQESYNEVVQTTIVDVEGDQKVIQVKNKPEQKNGGVAVFIGVMLSVIAIVAIGLAARQCFVKKEIDGDNKRVNFGVQPMQEMPEQELKGKTDYEAVNRCSIDLQPVYERQYDANNDFKIFGVGDQRQGGIQDMKQKMNLADKLDENSEEDPVSARIRKGTPEATSTLGGRKVSTEDSSQKSLKQIDNDLPEDQEVISDHDE